MGLVPIPSVLVLRNSSNKTSALADTNGTLTSGMPASSIQYDDLVISSKKLEGMATLNHAAKNMLLATIKYSGILRNSGEGTESKSSYSLFDKFKRQSNDPRGQYRKEQWVSMSGTLRASSFSDMCKAGKLSVTFNGNYAACIIPKHSGRSQRSTMLTTYYGRKQGDFCVQDLRDVPELLCIGVENSKFCRTGFAELEESNVFCPQELHWKKLSSSSETIPSSSDTTMIQTMQSVSIYKPEQDSPVSILDPFFDDASPTRPSDASTKPEKLPLRSHRISFEERSPVKRVKKLHSCTISKTEIKTSIPIAAKKHISSALEYTRRVLQVSDLNWYQLALNWNFSTQMLDIATYQKMKSQILTPLETRLLFDHINEVLLDTYHPYHGQHHDDIVKIVEMNLILKHDQVTEQELVIDYMEKCGTWMDTRRDLEDMVMEIADEVADELVEEFMFETWID